MKNNEKTMKKLFEAAKQVQAFADDVYCACGAHIKRGRLNSDIGKNLVCPKCGHEFMWMIDSGYDSRGSAKAARKYLKILDREHREAVKWASSRTLQAKEVRQARIRKKVFGYASK